jgi:hypothetical protein
LFHSVIDVLGWLKHGGLTRDAYDCMIRPVVDRDIAAAKSVDCAAIAQVTNKYWISAAIHQARTTAMEQWDLDKG